MKKKLRINIGVKIGITYLFIVLLLAAISFFNYTSFLDMGKQSDSIVLDTIPLGNAAANLLNDLVNQETGMRGYVVTGNETYLDPYYAGKEQLEKDLETIRGLVDQHPIMKDLVENQAYPEILKLQEFFEAQIERVKNGQSVAARQKIGDGKEAMDAFREVNSKILTDIDKLTNDAWEDSKSSAKQAQMIMMVGGGIILLFSILSALILNRVIVRPIKRVNKQLKEIAEGEGDLTRELTIKSNDELGEFAQSFNQMTANLRNLIRQVGSSTEQVAASAEELSATSEQASTASELIATTTQEVSAGTEKQVSSVEESSKAIHEMSAGVQQIAANANSASSKAIKTSETATEGNEAIQTAVKQMNSINHTVSELAQLIKGLGDRSNQIGEIVEVITDIAEQTNLLALNAAIEAARAGEHGRGFAVVADEVRKLAEQSSGSAQQITELISTIQGETTKAVQSMELGTKEVADGINVVNSAGHSFETIRHSINEVTQQIQEVSAASKQLTLSTEKVVSSIDLISEVAETTSSGTQNVSAAAQEQLASMEEISASASSLSKMAEDLQYLIGKFKV
jgi:methyl-accepting chemotaxis protein